MSDPRTKKIETSYILRGSKYDKLSDSFADLPTQIIYDILRIAYDQDLTEAQVLQLITHERMHQWAAANPGPYPSLSLH